MLDSQCASTGERTVTANHDQGIDTLFLNHLSGLCTTFRCAEFLAASRTENRTTALDDTGYVLGSKLLYSP